MCLISDGFFGDFAVSEADSRELDIGLSFPQSQSRRSEGGNMQDCDAFDKVCSTSGVAPDGFSAAEAGSRESAIVSIFSRFHISARVSIGRGRLD